MTKEDKLRKIAQEIENCRICKIGKSGKAVPGEGDSNAQIMFIGEAPGRNESIIGLPFIGRSGKFLREQIRKAGLREEDVFITSPVKYLPDRGTPSEKEILHGMTHLKKQMEVISPKFMVLLGSVAIQGVLGIKVPIMLRHGDVIKKDGISYFLTIHPAAAIRFKKNVVIIEEDFQKLRKLLSN